MSGMKYRNVGQRKDEGIVTEEVDKSLRDVKEAVLLMIKSFARVTSGGKNLGHDN